MKKWKIVIPCFMLIGSLLFAEPVSAGTQIYRNDQPDYSEWGAMGTVIEWLRDMFISPTREALDEMDPFVREEVNSTFKIEDLLDYLEQAPDAAKSSEAIMDYLYGVGVNEISGAEKNFLFAQIEALTGVDCTAGYRAFMVAKGYIESNKKVYNSDGSLGFGSPDQNEKKTADLFDLDYKEKDSHVKIYDGKDLRTFETPYHSYDRCIVFETYEDNKNNIKPYIIYDISPYEYDSFTFHVDGKGSNLDENKFHMEIYLDDQLIHTTESFNKYSPFIGATVNVSGGKELKIMCVREDHNWNGIGNLIAASVGLTFAELW